MVSRSAGHKVGYESQIGEGLKETPPCLNPPLFEECLTHILSNLLWGVLRNVIDRLPGVRAVGDAEAKREVVTPNELILQAQFGAILNCNLRLES
jgi:hypothetical protein